MSRELRYLRLRPAKTEEVTPEAQVGFLSSFLNIGKRKFWDALTFKPRKEISLELVSYQQKTYFYLVAEAELMPYLTSQILSQYPKTLVEETDDPMHYLTSFPGLACGSLKQANAYVYPVKTFKDNTEYPPAAAVLGFLAKIAEGEMGAVQMVVRIPNQGVIERQVRGNMTFKNTEGVEQSSPYKSLLDKKLDSPFVETQMKVVFACQEQTLAVHKLAEMAGAYGGFTLPESNALVFGKVQKLMQAGFMESLRRRTMYRWQPKTVLNLQEAASLWHLPDKSLDKIKLIDWGKTLLSEAPDNLPAAELFKEQEEEAKREVNFFAKTEWRNHEAIFGLKRDDRRKHMYLIGKTGSGKSTLIANMAINDIRNGEGVAVIDPHGDLSEMILDYIPKRRINDVIYLDPTLDPERNFSLNLFDNQGAAHTDVVASGIISVFHKLYYNSWGPRLEYILRNTILSLLYYGDATFADIIKMLTNPGYRQKVVEKIQNVDPVLSDFWLHEFENMNDKLRTEAISPILNKVGQFLSSQRIRQIVGVQHSTFSLDEVMNQKKILVLNLSQGKLGEDTTALLGAIFITKMQLTAMQRVLLSQEERPDFYLYVDEFQNFATRSFIKILSEARKYRLNLTLANQYVGQVDEEIQKAIFGNVGTLMTYVISAGDAALFEREFGGKFTAEDLVSLGRHEVLIKMTIDGLTAEPFLAKTLPLPTVINENRDKILKVNAERYYRKV